ncbi:MAG: helix-turn-helix domain-containing protein [Clostridiales Family XIII bacterium]|jgi:transcriptional regulator with XRE-family HTH domain|nr:helix-turn-helix domain-containing protein [Clostridiales Family XIII bacterium]
MNLREIRKARGLTVPALAEKADMPKRTIEDIDRRGDCRISTAIKLADALDMTLDELCGRERNE